MTLRILAGLAAYLIFLLVGAGLIGDTYWRSFITGLSITGTMAIVAALICYAAGVVS